EESDPHRLGRIHHVLAPALNRRFAEALAPARPPGVDRLAGAWTLHAFVHLARGVHLRRGQARGVIVSVRAIGALADQPAGIESAAARVVDDAVFQPVNPI